MQKQISAAGAQSRADFLRTQQQAVFSGFLTDVATVQQCQYALAGHMDAQIDTPVGTYDIKSVDTEQQDCQSSLAKLGRDVARLALVANADLGKSAQQIFDSLNGAMDNLNVYVQAVVNHDASGRDQSKAAWGKEFDPVQGLSDSLTSTMRSTLNR